MEYLTSLPSTPLDISNHNNNNQMSMSMSISEDEIGGGGGGGGVGVGGGGGFGIGGGGGDAAMMGAVFEDAWGGGWGVGGGITGFSNSIPTPTPIATTSTSTSTSTTTTTTQHPTSFSFPSQPTSFFPFSSSHIPAPPPPHHQHHQLPNIVVPQSMPTSTLFSGLNSFSLNSTTPRFDSISDDENDRENGGRHKDKDDDDDDDDDDDEEDEEEEDDDDEIMPFSFGETSSSPFVSTTSTSGHTSRRLSVMSDDSDGIGNGNSAVVVVGGGGRGGGGGVGGGGGGGGRGDTGDNTRPMKRARWDGDESTKGIKKGKITKSKNGKIIQTTTSSSSSSSTTQDGNLLAPPPAPKRPWNTSPQSTHLPSGSQLINPLTNELDLKPELLEGLTKEEIRKVKNRASAQRSRTRKWEVQEGLKGENERLREELERLRAEMEGNDEEETTGGGGGGGGSSGAAARDEEKDALKALVEKLRKEVTLEKKARMKAEAEVWSLKAQLEAAIVSAAKQQNLPTTQATGIPSPATSSEDDIMSVHGVDMDTSVDMHGTAEKGEMRRERSLLPHAKARAVGKDGKGVLMMVVLFSFALFTLPPHLRSSTYPTYLPLNANSLPLTEPPRPVLGRVLSFDDDRNLMRNASSEENGLVMVSNEENAACDATYAENKQTALCPAPAGLDQGSRGNNGRGATRGRKSFSFTLLRPINEDEEASDNASATGAGGSPSASTEKSGGEVEDVLQRWLGLSLFDDGKDRDTTSMLTEVPTIPGGWIVVDSSNPTGSSAFAASTPGATKTASVATTPKPKAWDGSDIEMMNLDTEMMSISAGTPPQNPNDLGLYPSVNGADIGPSPTLAPHVIEDPLAEEEFAPPSPPAQLIPGSFPRTPSHNRQPSRRIGSLPSSALMALGQNQAEKYMKLELEVDIEVEVSCTGVRRKNADDPRLPSGLSVVSKDEVGRILSLSNAAIGLDDSAVEERGLALRGMVADMGESGLSSGWHMV